LEQVSPSIPDPEKDRPLEPGATIGPYRVEGPLGEGGMGQVYKASGPGGTLVALKLVHGKLASDPVFRKRFEREASTATRVKHSHIVSVVDAGEHDGVPYMAQELIRGGTLADKIREEGRLDLETTVRFGLEIGKGLGALHAENLVHRDLKPANILLDEQGSTHITDFGLAKDRDASVLTAVGQAVGSMDYMAPEQIRGEDVDARTDVYALGCVMYECLAGGPPFADREGMKILWAHLQDEPPDPCLSCPDLSADVGWALTRALEKDAARRPATPTAYARMLQAAAGVPPLSTEPGA
jgi:serine/threonine-protein kinase